MARPRQHGADGVGENPGTGETHLFGPLLGARRRVAELGPDAAAAGCHFVAAFRQGGGDNLVVDTGGPQFLLQAPVAVAPGAGGDALASVTGIGEQLLGLQVVEQGVELFWRIRPGAPAGALSSAGCVHAG